MARLEEMVNPSELLDAIRNGALKNELLKKYRTSDQELAMMLLPLYRRGEMTKEEFNYFFQGVPLSGGEPQATAAEAVAPPKPPDEPPSEILQTLSKLFHRKSSAEPKAAQEEPPTVEEKILAPPEDKELPPPASPPPVSQEVESPLDLEIEEDEEIIEEKSPTVSAVIKIADSATLQDLVDTIFAKITAIENRLTALEKRVGKV